MNKAQIIVLVLAATLFAGLYFFAPLESRDMKAAQASRQIGLSATSEEALLKTVQEELPAEALGEVLALMELADQQAEGDTARLRTLESLSGAWYRLEQYALAGIAAEKVAQTRNSAEAWSIAGSTFFQGIRREKDDKRQNFCLDHAVSAFENALSLDPTVVDYRINLALCYVEKPPQDQPMRGILALRELNEQHPNNPTVLYHLGRLAVQTGQFDKAVERLEAALAIQPGEARSIELLIQAYEGLGQADKAAEWAKKRPN